MKKLLLLLTLLPIVSIAQIPSLTENSVLRFREGNTIFDRPVSDLPLDGSVTPAKTAGFTAGKIIYGGSTGLLTQSSTFGYDSTYQVLYNGTTTIADGQRLRVSNTSSGSVSLNAAYITQTYTGSTGSLLHKALRIEADHYGSGTGSTYNAIASRLQSNSSAAAVSGTQFYNAYLETYWTSSNTANPVGGIYNIVEGNNPSGTSNVIGMQNTVRKLSGAGTVGLIQGARFIASHNTTTGDVNEARAFQADAFNAKVNIGTDVYNYSTQNKASGYVTALYGHRLSQYNNSSYTVATAYGSYYDFTTNANTAITTQTAFYVTGTAFRGNNQYGFYANLANHASGSGTNWGVYIQQADKNYFQKNVLIGTTGTPGAYLHIKGAGATSGTYSALVYNSSDSVIVAVRDDRRMGINKDAPGEALDVNGQVRADAVDIRNFTGSSNTNDGQLQYHDGSSGTYSAYLTLGAGERRFPIMPTVIPLQAVDYNTDWTTGRTKAFWTVPVRYNGWKVSKVYLMVSTIGSTSGNTVEIEKGGVALATQTISSSDHTVALDENISTGDIFTFDITGTGATASKGLYVEIELRFQ